MRAGKRPRLGPQRHLHVARAQASAHTHAEDAQILRPLGVAQGAAQRFGRPLYQAVRKRADIEADKLVGPLATHPQLQRAVGPPANAQLQLVAITPLPLARRAGGHQLLGPRGVHAGRARKRGHHVVALGRQLGFVGQVRPRAPAAARRLRARRKRAIGRGLLDRHQARAGEGGLLLGHLHHGHIARSRAFHENSLAIGKAPHGL